MVEELISTLSKEIRTSITEDTSVPRNVRTSSNRSRDLFIK